MTLRKESYKPDFSKLRKKIKREQKAKLCWKCEHFKGFYFDGVTFDCAVDGDNQMWDFADKECSSFKERIE